MSGKCYAAFIYKSGCKQSVHAARIAPRPSRHRAEIKIRIYIKYRSGMGGIDPLIICKRSAVKYGKGYAVIEHRRSVFLIEAVIKAHVSADYDRKFIACFGQKQFHHKCKGLTTGACGYSVGIGSSFAAGISGLHLEHFRLRRYFAVLEFDCCFIDFRSAFFPVLFCPDPAAVIKQKRIGQFP